MTDQPPTLTDEDVHDRLVKVADELSAQAQRCATVRARTALATSGEVIYRLADALRVGMVTAAKTDGNDKGRR